MNGLGAEVFGGRMPAGGRDLAIETHGIKPVPEGNRFGRPWRLFSVWFAPNLTMTAVFTGTLGGSFGEGKGQPSQSIWVSHGCAPARFRNVNIINSGREI